MKGENQMKTAMNRLVSIIFFSLILSSCASLNPLDVLNPNKPSLEVNAQVGKTNEQEKNNIKLESGKQETKQEAEKITNDNNYTADKIENVVQGMSKFELIVFAMLAGIAIPTYTTMYKALKIIIGDVYNAVIVTPLKSLSWFVLKMLGRE